MIFLDKTQNKKKESENSNSKVRNNMYHFPGQFVAKYEHEQISQSFNDAKHNPVEVHGVEAESVVHQSADSVDHVRVPHHHPADQKSNQSRPSEENC